MQVLNTSLGESGYQFRAQFTSSAGDLTATSNAVLPAVVNAPQVTSLSPNAGVAGQQITINGHNFDGATQVNFAGVAIPAASFVSHSTTQIVVVAPTQPGGATVTFDVTVTTPSGGTSATVAADKFTYGAPTVTGLGTTSGGDSGGTSVVISGSGFTNATAVTFGGIAATSFTSTSDTSITAVAPAAANDGSGFPIDGTVDVVVANAVGSSAITQPADQFTYNPTSDAQVVAGPSGRQGAVLDRQCVIVEAILSLPGFGHGTSILMRCSLSPMPLVAR